MTADEMFEKLGYKKHKNQIQEFFDHIMRTVYGTYETTVIFWLERKYVEIQCNEDEKPCEYFLLDVGLTEAIHKKMTELGWRHDDD